MKIRNILLRDLKILLSDKKTLAVILLMPIILTTILSAALAGTFDGASEIPQFEVAVVKEYEYEKPDQVLTSIFENNLLGSFMPESIKKDLVKNADTDMEEVFFNEFLGHEEISKIMSYQVESLENAYNRLDNNEISAIIILPDNFLEAVYTNMYTSYNSEMNIEIVRNPERNLTPGIASSIVESFTNRMALSSIQKNAAIEAMLSTNIDSDISSDSKTLTALIEATFTENVEIEYLEETTSGNTAISSKSYYSAGMLTLFLLFSAGRGSYMLLQEKREFTYQRMLTAGLSKWQILSGKFFVIYGISVIQLIALMLYSTFVLGVYWGQPVNLLITSIFTAFAVAGLGSLLAVITFVSGKTRIAGLFESVIFQVMGLLGGAYIPIEVLPKEVQVLSKIPLNGVALKAFLELMSGSHLVDIQEQLLLLLLNGLIFTGFAVYLMGRKEAVANVSSDQAQAVRA